MYRTVAGASPQLILGGIAAEENLGLARKRGKLSQ